MTLKSFTLFLLLFLSLATSTHAQTLVPRDVHVTLTLAEFRTVYRIGEPVKLIMEFTADREGYVAQMLPDREQQGGDTVVISPEFGVTHWFDEMTARRRYLRDLISTAKLSKIPQRVELILNDTLRFDISGRYTVSVRTQRVTKHAVLGSRPITLTTNPITFEVVPMSYADEDAEVKRLSDQLSAARNWQTEEEVGKLLSFLTGEPSTREKVRRFINMDERSGNLNAHLWYGLFIASNRQLVVKLLEAALRDPSTPVSSQVLSAVTRLRLLVTDGVKADKPVDVTPMLSQEEDPRAREIRDAYVVELSAGLAKRKDKALTTTAITVASNLPKDPQSASVGSSEARRILIQQFDTLHPSIPLIEEAISELKADQDPAVLRELTALYYSEAIGVLVKKLLATDDRSWASVAAYLIGLHGSADDAQLLEARLKRWHEEWGNRVAEADAEHQGRIESELVWALTHGKSWKLSPDRVRELRMGCITQLCKQSNPLR